MRLACYMYFSTLCGTMFKMKSRRQCSFIISQLLFHKMPNDTVYRVYLEGLKFGKWLIFVIGEF